MQSTSSLGQRITSFLGLAICIAYSTAVGVASLAFFLLLFTCPLSDLYWEIFGKLAQCFLPNPDVFMVLGMSLGSFPCAFFLGRKVVEVGSKLGRENRLQLAYMIAVASSILWSAWSIYSLVLGPSGTDRLHILTSASMNTNFLFYIAGTVLAVRALRAGKMTGSADSQLKQLPTEAALATI